MKQISQYNKYILQHLTRVFTIAVSVVYSYINKVNHIPRQGPDWNFDRAHSVTGARTSFLHFTKLPK